MTTLGQNATAARTPGTPLSPGWKMPDDPDRDELHRKAGKDSFEGGSGAGGRMVPGIDVLPPADEDHFDNLWSSKNDPVVEESVNEKKRNATSYLGPGILVLNDSAWVTPERVGKLDQYDTSLPTGVYYGKVWLREEGGVEYLGMYLQDNDLRPGWHLTMFQPIQVLDESVLASSPCATCGHPKLSHMIGRPRPCNVFRCTCTEYRPSDRP